MNAKGGSFTTAADLEIVRDIKEKLSYTAVDNESAMKDTSVYGDRNYEMPDGRKIVIGNERFQAAEIIFSPEVAGSDLLGLPQYCLTSAMNCEENVRKDLYSNVVLSGGNTLFEGMRERMQTELQKLTEARVQVVAP